MDLHVACLPGDVGDASKDLFDCDDKDPEEVTLLWLVSRFPRL